MTSFRLSPSDLTFLWDGCPCCFYLKVARGFNRPFGPFPRIFNDIDALMTSHYNGRRTEQVAPGMPPGIIQFGQQWVQSRPLAVPGASATCFIRGRFDTAVAFDDGTFGLVDFKTSSRKAEHIPFYSRQLHAYAFALEQPAPGRFSLSPVTTLGLLVFEPTAYQHAADRPAALAGEVAWLEVPRNDGQFLAFLGEVVTLLEQPEPPEARPDCAWCKYRLSSRETGY